MAKGLSTFDAAEFNVAKASRTPASLAARIAVYVPMLGPRALKLTDSVMQALYGMWRERVSWLVAEPTVYEYLHEKKRITIMRNCHPPGVKLSGKVYWCSQPILCPFCYARQYVCPPVAHMTHSWKSGKRQIWIRDVEEPYSPEDYVSLEEAVQFARNSLRLRKPGELVKPYGSGAGFRVHNPFLIHKRGHSVLHVRNIAVFFGDERRVPHGYTGYTVDGPHEAARFIGERLLLPPEFLSADPASVLTVADAYFHARRLALYSPPKSILLTISRPETEETSRGTGVSAGTRQGVGARERK